MKTAIVVSVIGLVVGFANGCRAIRKRENEYHVRRLKYEALVRKVGPDKAMEMLKRGWDIVEGTAV